MQKRLFPLLFILLAGEVRVAQAMQPLHIKKLRIKTSGLKKISIPELKGAFKCLATANKNSDAVPTFSLSRDTIPTFIRLCFKTKNLTKSQLFILFEFLYDEASTISYPPKELFNILGKYEPEHPKTFTNHFRIRASEKLIEAIENEWDEAADYAIKCDAFLDMIIKGAIIKNNLWNLQRLILKGLIKDPIASIKYLVNTTNEEDNEEIHELKREAFYMLLERVPISTSIQFNKKLQKYFNYTPDAYITLQKADSKKKFKRWFDASDAQLYALMIGGTLSQLRWATAYISHSLGTPKNTAIKMLFYAALCSQGWCNIRRTLSMCAEQQVHESKEVREAIEWCRWAKNIPQIETAFAPINTQKNLIKSLCANMQKKNIVPDVKIIFR